MASDTSSRIIENLKAAGADFFMSVPCKLLAGMIDHLENDSKVQYTPVTREEEGIGIGAGTALAGRLPCLLMQDSGLGNSVNALAALTRFYQLPMVLVISYRGTPGEPVSAQVPMALITQDLLKLLGIPVLHCHAQADISEITGFVQYGVMAERPVAVLVDFYAMGNFR